MECPICLGPLNRCPDGIEDNVRRRLTKIRTATCCCTPCGHIFHKACLLTWLDQRARPPCPVCNVKISKTQLYPAYLNVDKDREGGSKQGKQNNLHSKNGSGNRSTVSSTGTASGTTSSGTSSKLSSNAPGTSGLTTTMTIGTYALTTFGSLPVFSTTATLGASSGAVPRTQPQTLGLASSSAFALVPQASFTLPFALPSPAASAGSGEEIPTGNRESETNNSESNTTEAQQQSLRGPYGTTPPVTAGTAFPSRDPGNVWFWDCPIHNAAYNEYPGLTSGHRLYRYSPYRQPPPAHATSSSSSVPRRITSVFNNTGGFFSTNNAAGNAASIAVSGRNGRRTVLVTSRGTQHHPDDADTHISNVDEFQTETEP